jgi:hypothetical protein
MKTRINPLTPISPSSSLHYPRFYRFSAILRSNRKWIAAAGLLGFLICSSLVGRSQANATNYCCQGSFGEVTLSYTIQPGSTLGIGMEGGNWNKESSRISYFLGTKMQFYHQTITGEKINSNNDVTNFYIYVKGQYRLVDELFLVASPQIMNLNSLDFVPGLRYVFPLGNGFGVGLEPAYSIRQQQFTLSANIHIAL